MTGNQSGAESPSGGRGAGRAGKRQIVCFLTPDQNHAARIYAQSMGMTRQSLLGRAINRFLESLGERPLLNDKVTRLLCMTNPRVRKFHNPYGRYGKSALAGWFSDDAVTDATIALMKHGSNFQQAAVSGLVLLGAASAERQLHDDVKCPESTGQEPAFDSAQVPAVPNVMEADGFPDLINRDADFPDF